MSLISLCLAFGTVTIATYLLFKLLALNSTSLIFRREEAIQFQKKLQGRFGLLAISSTIFGTLTSLATVYVFFIGTSKLFGFYVFAAPASIALSFLFTNWLTKRALANRPSFSALLGTSEITTAVVARLIWEPTSNGRTTTTLIKWLSIINIVSVLWLEFSVFGDLAAIAFGKIAMTTWGASLIVFFATFTIFLIILRYGLRGFVVADILHGPFVVAGTFAVLIGILITIFSDPTPSQIAVFQPSIPESQIFLFVIHVFALNSFFVLLTEGHWFRLWLFQEREIKNQAVGTIGTAAIWSVLALAGCLGAYITSATGTDGIAPILSALDAINPALTFLFWFGASAALFSATDAQIYGLILVWNFRPADGEMSSSVNRPSATIGTSLFAATVFSFCYGLTRYFEIPFEKLVFTLFPVCLNILPAFLAVSLQRRLAPVWTALSIVLYGLCTIIGFMRPHEELAWTLMAALTPILVSAIMLCTQKTLRSSPAGERQ